MTMNLDTYIIHIHQILYESINTLKQILFWDGGSTNYIDRSTRTIDRILVDLNLIS
jgi:hypothetical protein